MESDSVGLRGVFQVNRSGVLVVAGGAGPIGETAGETCTAGTRFQAASVSKMFVAASMMLLSERGAVRLDDPVRRWWPAALAAWESMTLGHLLAHSSGLGHWRDIPGLDISSPPGRDEILRRAAALELLSLPGTVWAYSGVGYLLAAAIVEAASGQSYGSFVAENVFLPLAMTSTTSGVTPDGGGVAGPHVDGQLVPTVAGLSGLPGTGDVWTTVADLIAYAEAARVGTLLSATSRRLMQTPKMTIVDDPDDAEVISTTSYGYGIFLGSLAGAPVLYHPGDNPGFRSFLCWLPETDVTLAVLSNDESTDLNVIVPRLIRMAGVDK